MDIKYLGHSSFRLRGKNAAVVTDPFDPKIVGQAYPKVSADVITVSHDHADHNKRGLVAPRTEGVLPVVVVGPGEYEVKGVKIYGYQTFHDAKNGEERGKNTAYVINIDDINILHCGDLGHIFSEVQLEEMGEVHILIVPVGGHFTINEKEALSVVRQIDPHIVIPMHYNESGKAEMFNALAGVDSFLKEIGKTVEPTPKLTITYDKLPEEMEVVVLSRG